ncbi:hypothetical protein D9613_012609 [Agrocybe pediades]|uniref:Peptidase S54 rhomboid domain-containing protein n=1 Tax=Agrocybe pediades TaxID=84607 RepID=A0A8H4VT72_9AGAR|nr:hypothetical protein D9613_012609 [Agrocybe pediades]
MSFALWFGLNLLCNFTIWELAVTCGKLHKRNKRKIAEQIKPIADALVYLNVNKVHPVWFPYSWAPTLHAARISMIYQTNAKKSPTPLSWGTYIVGFLIMLLNPTFLDTLLWPIDTLLRANAVTATLGLLSYPSVHREYRDSALTHLLIGAIASSGGGLSASTLSTWAPNWSFSTPPVLRAGAGWVGTLDVWGGALVALIYSSATGHPAFASVRTYATLLLSSPLVSLTRKPHADSDFPPLDALGAKSLATAVLGVFFAARVLKTHWLGSQVPPAAAAKKTPKKKSY